MFEAPLIPSAAWMPVIDVVLKATMLLAAAAVVSFTLRRGSAASRHMVWTLALAGVLVLPVLSVAVPRWQVSLITLDQRMPQSGSSFPEPGRSPESAAGVAAVSVAHADAQHLSVLGPSVPPPARRLDSVPASGEPASIDTRFNLSWPVLLITVWLTGAALVLGRLLVGIVAVHCMSRRIERVTTAPWLAQARSLAGRLGVSPRIIFLRSGRAAMPMAWGIFRPAVLMPADADRWPAERLRIVLLHELAHVRRRDCLTHMLAQVACAFHWFNPLAWMAARRARAERERACDDLVLAAGTRGPDYANQLIEIARVMRSGRFPAVLAGASLAMAHRSELEGRLLAILDPRVPRAGVSRLRRSAATAVCACAVLPLASIQPWTVAAADRSDALPAAQAAQAPSPQPDPVPDPAPSGSADNIDPARAATSVRRAVQGALATGISAGVAASVESSVAHSVAATVQSSVAHTVAGAVQSAIAVTADTLLDPHINVTNNIHVNNRGSADGGGQARAADPRTVAALTAALKDTDKDVRETALHALVQMRDPGIYEPLVQALSDSAPDVREQAAAGLGQLRDRRAVQPLTNALKDSNADVREQAAFALGQLRDRSAVPGLTAALSDSDDDVREQAVFALGQLRDPAAVEPLISAVRDAKPDVREQAVFALGQIRDRRALEPLISALKDSAPDVREQAAFALGQIRDRGAVEALVIALKDSAADVREQVAFALGQIRDARAIDGLTAALKDASADVRRQAAFALGQLAR